MLRAEYINILRSGTLEELAAASRQLVGHRDGGGNELKRHRCDQTRFATHVWLSVVIYNYKKLEPCH